MRHRDSEDEFHITTFFRVRFARDKLLSTLVELLFAIQIMLSVQKIPSWESSPADLFESLGVKFIDRLSCNRIFDAQDWLIFVVFLYGGNIPFVVSLCFASQRIPTACPNCAGSISTIGLAPFCFKSAGVALS